MAYHSSSVLLGIVCLLYSPAAFRLSRKSQGRNAGKNIPPILSKQFACVCAHSIDDPIGHGHVQFPLIVDVREYAHYHECIRDDQCPELCRGYAVDPARDTMLDCLPVVTEDGQVDQPLQPGAPPPLLRSDSMPHEHVTFEDDGVVTQYRHKACMCDVNGIHGLIGKNEMLRGNGQKIYHGILGNFSAAKAMGHQLDGLLGVAENHHEVTPLFVFGEKHLPLGIETRSMCNCAQRCRKYQSTSTIEMSSIPLHSGCIRAVESFGGPSFARLPPLPAFAEGEETEEDQ